MTGTRREDPCDERFLDAGLEIIARDGWRGLTMSALARETGETLSTLYRERVSKISLLKGLIRHVDIAALEDADIGAPDTESPRDRLFDAVMLRFEAMESYRDALRVLVHDLPRDPVNAAALLPHVRRSLRWTLEAAGFRADGLAGALRIRLLGLICWRSLQVWLDDGEDLARTMADLDRRLRKAERWLAPERGRPAGDGRSSGAAESRSQPTEEAAGGNERDVSELPKNTGGAA